MHLPVSLNDTSLTAMHVKTLYVSLDTKILTLDINLNL